MHARTELGLALVLAATVAGCDDLSAGGDTDGSSTTAEEATADVVGPRVARSLDYADREDFEIQNDRSNLRRDELSPLEHRRWLSRRERDELLHDLEGAVLPTDEEIASVSMRWFATGAGIAVQNPTTRRFTVSAWFSASAEPACGVGVPNRVVAAGESVLLSPPDSSDCKVDRADVSLTDEYGFLVNLLVVEARGRKP